MPPKYVWGGGGRGTLHKCVEGGGRGMPLKCVERGGGARHAIEVCG